jgi:hypothetical protein
MSNQRRTQSHDRIDQSARGFLCAILIGTEPDTVLEIVDEVRLELSCHRSVIDDEVRLVVDRKAADVDILPIRSNRSVSRRKWSGGPNRSRPAIMVRGTTLNDGAEGVEDKLLMALGRFQLAARWTSCTGCADTGANGGVIGGWAMPAAA